MRARIRGPSGSGLLQGGPVIGLDRGAALLGRVGVKLDGIDEVFAVAAAVTPGPIVDNLPVARVQDDGQVLTQRAAAAGPGQHGTLDNGAAERVGEGHG